MTGVSSGSMVATRPRLSDEAIRELLHGAWGLEGDLAALPSERDQNVRVDIDGHPAFVLKIANPAEDPALLDAQEATLERLVAAGLPVGRGVPSVAGQPVHTPVAGRVARARLVTWLEGTPVAELDERPPGLPEALGELMGRVTAALDGLEHPGADRPFQWDVRRAGETIRAGLDHVVDPSRRRLLERALARIDGVRLGIDALRRSVIHNDANDHNVLLDGDGRISGLLDLGDLVWSVTAAEPAVAAIYLAGADDDPLEIAARVVGRFHGEFPLTDAERAAIPDLLLARVAISVSISALQTTLDPDPYLRISEGAMWARLARLDP
jgi:Ser/Thr protein kinase RdoA (MazF antagonist)